MQINSLINHCTEVMKIILKSSNSEDDVLSEYFRSKKYIGSKERKIIAEIVFLYLRFKGLSDFVFYQLVDNSNFENFDVRRSRKQMVSDSHLLISLYICNFLYPEILSSIYQAIEDLYKIQNPKEYLQIYIIDHFRKNFRYSVEKILEFFNSLNFTETKSFEKNFDKNSQTKALELASIRYSIPEFILASWMYYYSPKGIDFLGIAESLLFPAPITIRINPMLADRTAIINLLEKQKINGIPTNYSPFGIILQKRLNLRQLDIYKNGLIDVQDEGSQLVCIAVSPNTKDRILDACAGAGGKSLLLAQMQEDKGEIIANDINFLKLRELRRRAERAKLRSIQLNLIKGGKINSQKEFDVVLVDAPCSGIGTARRNPMHKWRLNPQRLNKIVRKQLELLEFYSKFVRRNGILLYSTCSLMPEENIQVVENFLRKNHHFAPFPIKDAFDKFGINFNEINEQDYHLTLFPSVHKTDGFFICKMKRIK